METKKTKKANIEGLKGIFFECGLIAGLFLMVVAFSWSSSKEASIVLQDNITAVEEEVDIPITEEITPPPPADVEAPIVSDEMNIVDNTMDIQTTSFFSSEDDDRFAVVEMPYTPKKEVEKEDFFEEDFDISVVPEKPSFMGGDANSFSKWVSSRIIYPTIDQENNVQGKVILQFRIAPDGTLGNIKVLRSISPGLDKEAIRVVSSSPKWTPGKMLNKPVGVIYTFSVNFVLSN